MKTTISIKNFNNQTIILKENLGIILGNANSGKTKLLDLLNDGFKGVKNHIEYNNKIVSLGEYNVIYVSDDLQLAEDIKISKTSDIKRYLISYLYSQFMNNSKYYEVQTLFNDFKVTLSEIINSNLLNNISYEDLQLTTNILDLELEKYIEKLVLITLQQKNIEKVEIENYSKSKLRKLWYELLKNIKVLDHKKPNVVLIDSPELYGGPLEWNWWCNLINDFRKRDHICLICTMNPFIFDYLDWELESINFINNNQIKKINSFKFIQDYIIFSSYIEQSEFFSLSEYKSEIKKVITKEDIIKETKNIKLAFCNLLKNYLLNKKLVVNSIENYKNTVLEILFRYEIEGDLNNIEFSENIREFFKISQWF